MTPACGAVLCSQPLHLAFAALFFVSAAWIVLALFTLSDTPRPDWPAEKVRHNRICETCGTVMVTCLLLIVAEALGAPLPLLGAHPACWLEAAAIWAFACAWLTKGKALAPLAEGLRRMGGAAA